MGLIRKVTSVGTLGLIDFRSAKDRTASSTKKTAKQMKEQTAIMRQQARGAHSVSSGAQAPGWYYCVGDPAGSTRLWDGTQWTANTRP